ncbi:PorP/SprF family type IX secretion system membrane protein [Pedobacter sp. MW01-1-1]|uniref:PorP/SprF family type IX secretion system membrane protein n=1 Tax=Pedobacter sp. MW01-1-1 TaxID=3383027 RepID=UPI003FF0632F
MKRILIFFVCFVNFLGASAQQNAQFGQYVFNGLFLNPAYAGYKEELYMQVFARSQWTGVKGAPQTLSISVDEAIDDEALGIGLLVSKDKIGAQSTLNFSGNLAYRIKLDQTETNVLAFGMGLGVMQMSVNGSLLNPIESGDARISASTESRTVPDIRVGIHYSNEKFFIGFSINNLLSQYLSVFKENLLLSITSKPHLYLTAGLALPLNEDLILKPSFLIKDDLGGPTSIDLNTYFLLRERLGFGAVYRSSLKLYPKANLQPDLTTKSAVGFIAEFFIQKNLRIGYGYDYNLSKLGSSDYGSHEVSIGYYLNTAKSRRPKCYF